MDTFTVVFGGAFLIIGLVLTLVAILQYRKAKKIGQTWLTCAGIVQGTNLEAHSSHNSDGSPSINYYPQVFYQYTVNGQLYTGNRIGFGRVFYDYSTACRKLKPYPQGAPVVVHYDPADPSQAVLETKAMGGWIFLLIGIVFTVIGVLALIFLPAIPK